MASTVLRGTAFRHCRLAATSRSKTALSGCGFLLGLRIDEARKHGIEVVLDERPSQSVAAWSKDGGARLRELVASRLRRAKGFSVVIDQICGGIEIEMLMMRKSRARHDGEEAGDPRSSAQKRRRSRVEQ